MKELKCLSREDISVKDSDIPEIADDEALIKTIVCGLCGSDIVKILDNGIKKPVKLGHEVVGIVDKAGRSVKKIKEGDLVLVSHHLPCYRCIYCLHGNFSMCKTFKETNLCPQGFSEYIKLSSRHIKHTTFKILQKEMVKKAVFTEPAACCLRAVKRLKINRGDNIAVIGSGTIGLIFSALFTKIHSAKVTLIDIDDDKLSLSKRFGAENGLNPVKEDVVKKLKQKHPLGVDIVELTFTNSQTIATAFDILRDGGQIQIFAGPSGERVIGIDFEELYKREITLMSSYSASPEELEESLGLILDGTLDFSRLITEILPIEDFSKGLEKALDKSSFKILFYFDKKLAEEYL